jgi:sugar/nucleoside kinase (ribokinase family)
MSSIAAVGNVCLDTLDDAPPRPGGTVFYAARTLARLGAEARIAASCADADAPLLRPALEAFGPPVSWYESETTSAFRMRYSGAGRRTMRLEAVGKAWSAEEAVDAVASAEWIHVGALVRTDFRRATLAALAGGGRKVLADGQGLVRCAVLGPLRSNGEIGDVLRFVTLLKLDQSEAELLAGGADPEAVRSLGVREVLLTLGAQGSIVVTADTVVAVPAAEIGDRVDPTGAGDTYSAAYLVARSRSAEPAEAARSATDVVAELLAART